MEILLNPGITWVVLIQGFGEWLLAPMKLFSFLGSEEFFLFFLPVVYWCLDTSLGLRVGFILLFSGGLNDILKLSFQGPRPYWFSLAVKAMTTETSFGVPSGHAQIAVGVWGMVASHIRRSWAWITAILVILLIGISRMYLGVHFPHDVILGWLIGSLTLWLFIRFWDPIASWLKKIPPRKLILLAFGVSIVIILIGGLVFAGLRDWVIPEVWLEKASRAGSELPAPVTLSGIITSAGTLFGLMVGVVWMTGRGGFNASGPVWQRIVRYIIGLVGVMILYQGLKFIFPTGENVLAYVFRYLRYTMVGAWISAGAPWVFIKSKIALPTNSKKISLT